MPFRIYCDTVSCVRHNCTDILTTASGLPDQIKKIVRYACRVAVTNTCLIRNLVARTSSADVTIDRPTMKTNDFSIFYIVYIVRVIDTS